MVIAIRLTRQPGRAGQAHTLVISPPAIASTDAGERLVKTVRLDKSLLSITWELPTVRPVFVKEACSWAIVAELRILNDGDGAIGGRTWTAVVV